MLDTILVWLNRAVVFGSVIMYGALGETLTQKSGNMNLGTPGVMCIGGAFGFGGAYLYEINAANPSKLMTVIIGLLAGFLASALAGLLFSFITTTLRANQNVTGLALTIFGSGLAKFFGTYIIPKGTTTVKAVVANKAFSAKLPFVSDLGVFGKIFLNYGFMMYLVIILAILMSLFFKKTRAGLNLRAVGENHAASDAAGINVTKYKYLATVIGCGISGLGGVYYVLDYNYGGWDTAGASGIESLGWLAVALVIFAVWKPINLIWGSYMFGVFFWLYNYISVFGLKTTSAQNALLEIIPYVVTIIVLVISSIKKKKENQPPASLGLSYFREER